MPALTLFDELLLVLAAIYAFECVAWPGWGAWVCATLAGVRRRPFGPLEFPSNDHGGAAATGIFPFDVGFQAEALALSLSPEGVVCEPPLNPHPARRAAGTGVVLAWHDLRRVRARGDEVRVEGTLLAAHLAPESARRLAVLLRRLAALAPQERETAIRRHFDRSLRAREADRRAKHWLKASLFQRAMATCSFLFVFVGAPLGEHLFGLTHHWPVLAMLFLWWHLLAASEVVNLHARFFPAQRMERFKRTLMAFLSPATAMRSGSQAAQGLMAGLHPLAVAVGTCRRKDLPRMLAFAWRDAHHPLPPEIRDPAGRRIVDWHRAAWRESLARFARMHGLDAETMAAPAQSETTTAQSRCPRCLAGFTQPQASCAACGGMKTVPCGK